MKKINLFEKKLDMVIVFMRTKNIKKTNGNKVSTNLTAGKMQLKSNSLYNETDFGFAIILLNNTTLFK